MKNNGITHNLRTRAVAALGKCDKCGGTGGGLTYKEAAAQIGSINAATLWRFLSGKSASSSTLDAIAAWLAKVEPKPRRAGRRTA